MNKISHCPICESSSFSETLRCIDYTVSQEEFTIVECNKCHFQFTNPKPQENEIGRYYESEEYISHSNTNKGLIHKLYQVVRNKTLKDKLKLIDRFGNERTLLDIGSGTGEFLNVCQKNGWTCKGIEPSEKARSFAIDTYQLDISPESEISLLKENSYCIVTMWHVLEHVYHLNQRLSEIKKLLKPSGTLVVAVPNRNSHDAEFYEKYWAAYDLPRHLYHFTPNDIKNLADKFDFELIDTKPMRFDSFYVSMLSEKYKTGKINYTSAFLRGLVSNLKAKSKKSFSSQIYFLKNKK